MQRALAAVLVAAGTAPRVDAQSFQFMTAVPRAAASALPLDIS
jgi:hypothetical protein